MVLQTNPFSPSYYKKIYKLQIIQRHQINHKQSAVDLLVLWPSCGGIAFIFYELHVRVVMMLKDVSSGYELV